MKKGLLIQPPQWIPTAPHLAVPLLAGILRQKGLAADAADLSVRFYDWFLSADHLKAAAGKIEEIAADETYGVSAPELPAAETARLRRSAVLDFLKDGSFNADVFAAQAEGAVKVLRDGTAFYDPARLFDPKEKLSYTLRTASLPYYPARLAFDTYYGNGIYGYTWEALRAQAERPGDNLFYGFLKMQADRIADEAYAWIGISVTDLSQLLAAVTLGRLIKKASPKTPVLFGGNYLTQIRTDIEACPEFFDFCCDAVSFGDGERVFPLLVQRCLSGLSFEGVPETAFLKDGRVCVGVPDPVGFDIDATAFPCFDGYDFSLYLAPEPVFPVQLSKGCYWGKCAFCDYFNGEPCFYAKSVSRAADELQYCTEACGARAFFIVDEALPPAYLSALADEILRRKLKLCFYAFARLEDSFTPEVLSKLRTAGALLLMWGYEAASPRVMRLLNKGIDPENRLSVLRRAADAGIWNNGLFIIGSPTETADEAYATLDVIKKNLSLFHSVTLANFNLTRNAAMMHAPEKYGVGAVRQSAFLKKLDDASEGMSVTERLRLRAEFDRALTGLRRGRPWTTVYSDFDHLLLYLARYGRSVTDSIRLPDRRTQ